MPRESTIRIFRSDTAAAVPSLTAGEIAVNIPDQRLFVGNSTGGVIPFFGNGVSGINGITGGVSITSGSNITITQSGKQITVASSITQYTAPLATSSVTGVASFRAADFDVSTTGSVSLTGTVARTNTSQTFTGLQNFSSGLSSNGLTGTILTPSQTNITAVGTLTSLNTAGITSSQRVNVSAGGLVVQAGGLSVTGGATITGGLNAYGNTTTWGSLAAKSTVNIEMGGLRSQLGATFGDPNYGFGNDPVINLYRANNELLRIGAARGGNYLGGLNNQYVFDILGPNTAQTRLFTFRRATNFDGASASNHVTIMSFDTSDNVGIRTASPGATFDVAGTLRASGIGTFTGGLTANNLFVSQGTTFGSGINVISGGISVTGGIAGTLLTPTQPNVTQVGSLVSLTSAGATFSQRVNITNGGLSAGGGIIVQSGGIGVTGGMHVTGGANIYGLVGINLSGSSPIDNLTVFGNYGLFAASLQGGGTSQYFNIRSYHANAAVAYDQYDVYNWGATVTKWIGRWYGGGGVQTAYIMGVVDDLTGYPNQNTHTTFNTSPSTLPRDAAVIYIGSGNSGGNQRTSLYAEQGAVLAASGGTVGIGTNSPGAKLDVNGTFRSLGRASFPVGLTSANLFVDAGATFGANIYAPNMVTGVNGITGAVSITSGSNITITQSGKQITIASSASGGGGITWSVITTDQSLTVNTGVLANKSSGTLTLTLPTTAAVGTSIRVSGMQNTWRVAQNASQKINFGSISTTTGTGGYLESTNARDSVELVCCVANTEWNVVSSIGNMTIV